MKFILNLFLAVLFGYLFTSSYTLGTIYHNFDLGILYAVLGFIVLILFFCSWYLEEIINKIKIKRYNSKDV